VRKQRRDTTGLLITAQSVSGDFAEQVPLSKSGLKRVDYLPTLTISPKFPPCPEAPPLARHVSLR
jgi:hypothetical protein